MRSLLVATLLGSTLTLLPWSEDEEQAAPAAATASAGEVSVWHRETLADGATVQVSVLLADEVLASSPSRPVAVSVEFLWKHGLMGSLHALEKAGEATSEALDFRMSGFTSQLSDPDSSPDPRAYVVSVRPADGLTWGAVRDDGEVVVEVTIPE